MARVPPQRFPAVLLALVILGTGGLGYCLYASYGRYVEVSEAYGRQAVELLRLQRLTPYPEETNRQRYEARRQEYDEAVRAFQVQLARESPELEKINATEFQNRLREVVAGVVASARQNNVALPDGFYLGFEPYRAGVPPAGAVPLLVTQLKGCEGVARTLIQRRVGRLTAFRRATLREEGDPPPDPAPPDYPGGGKPPSGGADGNRAPVTFYPLEVEFQASPDAFHEVMDDLLQTRPLQVIRALRVKNERDKGPGRGPAALDRAGGGVPGAAIPTSTPFPRPPGRPDAVEPPLPDRVTLRYVVGTERLDVQMRLELARFKAP